MDASSFTNFQLQFAPISSLIGAFDAAGRHAFNTLTCAATFWATERKTATCSESGWALTAGSPASPPWRMLGKNGHYSA
jgi:hypothetical protein